MVLLIGENLSEYGALVGEVMELGEGLKYLEKNCQSATDTHKRKCHE
jgi:hypothetical protein